MAIQAICLVAVWFLAYSATSQPCGVSQCKLFPVRGDFAFTFQQLASEKGVRLVYFNLEIGNNNVHPLESSERFLAKRWIWAKTIREPMLLMTDDVHDVHSLGLLRRQKRYMTVQLAEQPAGCLANLNVSCQDNVVGKTLLSNVTNLSPGNRLPPTDCVCSFHTKKMCREGWEIGCCSVKEITEKNITVYRCGIAPENDWFVKPFHVICSFLQWILMFCSPAIFLLLPDWVFNVMREWSKEKEEQIKINQESLNRQQTPRMEQIVEYEDARFQVSQQHMEMTKVENTVKPNDNAGENSKNPKELDRRYIFERNVSVVHEDEDQREMNRDNPVSPNQQLIVETEQTMESEDDTLEDLQESLASSEKLDRICEEKLSAVHKAQKEIDFEIPVDDMSPITFLALISDFVKKFPVTHMNFNVRLILVFFVLFPVVEHTKRAVIFFYELEFYHEVYRKFNYSWSSNIIAENALSFQSIGSKNWRTIVEHQQAGLTGIDAVLYGSLFVILTLVRPKDLLCRRALGSSICGAPFGNSVSVGENIIHNLTIQSPLVCKLASSVLELYMTVLKKCLMKLTLRRSRGTRLKRALRSWYVTLCLFPGFLLATAFGIASLLIFLIMFVLLLILTSPLATVLVFVLKKAMDTTTDLTRSFSRHIAFKPIVWVLVIVSYLIIFFTFLYFSISVISGSVQVMINTFLFTIMAVVLNVEFVTPYVAFILVVAGNVHLCFLNLQKRYKEVKNMISKHWEEQTTNLFWIKCSNNGTIPKELFWSVCSNEDDGDDFEEQILPLRTEICLMLRDMALIILFLGLFFFAVIVFETMEEISALVSTVFVFISGIIPQLIFKTSTKKKQFSGWDKIKIDNKIKEAVRAYVLAKMEKIPFPYEVSESPTRGRSRPSDTGEARFQALDPPPPTVLVTAV